MSISIKYKCKENDNQIRFEQEDGDEQGEFWISDERGKTWTVIGAKDMAAFLVSLDRHLFSMYDLGGVR